MGGYPKGELCFPQIAKEEETSFLQTGHDKESFKDFLSLCVGKQS
jgi:hypothetical protein